MSYAFNTANVLSGYCASSHIHNDNHYHHTSTLQAPTPNTLTYTLSHASTNEIYTNDVRCARVDCISVIYSYLLLLSLSQLYFVVSLRLCFPFSGFAPCCCLLCNCRHSHLDGSAYGGVHMPWPNFYMRHISLLCLCSALRCATLRYAAPFCHSLLSGMRRISKNNNNQRNNQMKWNGIKVSTARMCKCVTCPVDSRTGFPNILRVRRTKVKKNPQIHKPSAIKRTRLHTNTHTENIIKQMIISLLLLSFVHILCIPCGETCDASLNWHTLFCSLYGKLDLWSRKWQNIIICFGTNVSGRARKSEWCRANIRSSGRRYGDLFVYNKKFLSYFGGMRVEIDWKHCWFAIFQLKNQSFS